MSVRPDPVAVGLGVVAGVLAALAAAVGLLSSGASGAAVVTSVHGQQVELYGTGLYHADALFRGAGNRGTDVVTLALALPLLAWSLLGYRRGSTVGALLLSGALAWTGYVYATLALGTVYNELFLVYVAAAGASAWGLALVVRSTTAHAPAPALPRRRIGVLLLAAAGLTGWVWVAPVVDSLVSGEPPEMLWHSTTLVTEALDLAVLLPATVLAGVGVLRRRPAALRPAVPLLVLLVLLAPAIVAQTAFQLEAGYAFTTPQLVGPVGGFLVMGTAAAWALVRVLRSTSQADARTRRSVRASASSVTPATMR
jgi:hypothetical protein